MEHILVPEATAPPPCLLPPGKDELNLAEFPIALLTDRVPSGQKTIEFQDQFYDDEEGTGHHTEADHHRLRQVRPADLQGRRDPPRPHPAHEAGQRLHRPAGRLHPAGPVEAPRLGGHRPELPAASLTSLCRWASVFLYWENSWWDQQHRRWTTRGFHIIDSFEINDGRRAGRQAGTPRFAIHLERDRLPQLPGGIPQEARPGLLPGAQDLDLEADLSLPGQAILTTGATGRSSSASSPTNTSASAGPMPTTGRSSQKLQPALEELEAMGFLEPMARERALHQGRQRRVENHPPESRPVGGGRSGAGGPRRRRRRLRPSWRSSSPEG